MTALDRKLLRDLRLMWSQVLTIALVVASGVGGFITSLSAVDSLALARDRFYASGHFADVFASVKRAPNALAASLLATPGVADVQTTLEQVVRIELPGVADPVLGQLIGVDALVPPRLNLVTLRTGAVSEAGFAQAQLADQAIPALVSAGFATLYRPKKTYLTFDCTPTYLVSTKVTISHIFCREEQGWLRR